MFQILCIFLISISAANQSYKAPAFLQHNKQAPGWLDSDQNTSTNSQEYTTPIDLPSVNLPTEETIWEHGDSGIRVTWDGVEGTLIKVSLLKNGSLVAEVIGWCDNDESEVLDSSVLASWGSGSGFQVQIEDNLGNTLTSETFRIMAPINISEPRITTVWSHSERDVLITWSGSPGNTVDIVLFDGDNQIATLASSIHNTGTYTYSNAISSSWGTGDNYSVRVIDDIGNEYNSRHFTINAINVTSPASGTIWSDRNPNLNVTWEGGARVVRISLYSGSTKIKDLTEWIDNTGSYEITDFLSQNLDAGSNYRIEVRDDQGDQGFSLPFFLRFSLSTPNGAVPFSTVTPQGDFNYIGESIWLKRTFQENERIKISFDSDAINVQIFDDNLNKIGDYANNKIILLENHSATLYFLIESVNSSNYSFTLSQLNLRFLPRSILEGRGLFSTNPSMTSGGLGFKFLLNIVDGKYQLGIANSRISDLGRDEHGEMNLLSVRAGYNLQRGYEYGGDFGSSLGFVIQNVNEISSIPSNMESERCGLVVGVYYSLRFISTGDEQILNNSHSEWCYSIDIEYFPTQNRAVFYLPFATFWGYAFGSDNFSE